MSFEKSTTFNWVRLVRGLIVLSIVALAAYYIGREVGTAIAARSRDNRFQQQRDKLTQAVVKQMKSVTEGDTIPDFYFEDMDRDLVRLRRALKTPTVLIFFEPDCGICLEELRELQSVVRNPDATDRFVFVSSANPFDLRELWIEDSVQFELLYDHGGRFITNLNISSSPVNMIVDESGGIMKIIAGRMLPREMTAIANGKEPE